MFSAVCLLKYEVVEVDKNITIPWLWLWDKFKTAWDNIDIQSIIKYSVLNCDEAKKSFSLMFVEEEEKFRLYLVVGGD